MKTDLALMATYGKTHLTFEEVCKEIGIKPQTGYNWRHEKRFPIRMFGNPLIASVKDVADYLDNMRKEAK
jgi:hypothetical protein